MNSEHLSNYKEYLADGKFSDLTIVERSASGLELEYKVHWVIMYTGCEYIQCQRDAGMKDAKSNKIVITTESLQTGLLQPIINAIYSYLGSDVKNSFRNYIKNHNIDDSMALYRLCSFLQLPASYNKYIVRAISFYFDEGKLVEWWRGQHAKGLHVPEVIETIIQKYIKSNITYISNTKKTYIAVDTLLHLWESGNDPFAQNISEYLKSLTDAGAESDSEIEDDFMESESEEEYVPKSRPSPRRVVRVANA